METNEKSRVLDMTRGNPFRLVLKFALPLFFGNLLPDVVVATLKLVNVPTEPKLPQTGDNANPLLYLGIGALALITGVGVGLRGRKKKNKQ